MNEIEQHTVDSWHASNDKYLAESIAWLRARLERLAGDGASGAAPQISLASPPAPQTAAPATASQRSWMGRLFAAAPPEHSVTPEAPTPSAVTRMHPEDRGAMELDATLPASLLEAEHAEQPPALVMLAKRLGLSDFERNVLLLCAAMEFDTRILALCARAQRDPARSYPTFALALTLFDQPAWDVLSPERPLRYWRLLDINQPGAQPLTTSALRADERIVNYIKGLNYLDDRLVPLLTPLDDASEGQDLPPSQRSAVDNIVRGIELASKNRAASFIELLGADSASKRMVAQCAANELGLHLYRLSPQALPVATADLENFARLWQRESALLPIGIYIDAHDLDKNDTHANAVKQWLSRCSGVIFLETREPWPHLKAPAVTQEIRKPTPVEQRDAWREALTATVGDSGAIEQSKRLAGQFNFNLSTIHHIANQAQQMQGKDAAPAEQRVWEGCLTHARPLLDQLAQRLDTKATWLDLKLPRPELTQLEQIAAQVAQRTAVYEDFGFRSRMNRGLGISVLFAGESGTGKTMAAEVLANALVLMLYRIDLSAVVSKYIGETEKNLRKLFDAAEDGGAILFFDEADALFGKRSEVKDSHDRYANIEINYLLQRMEAYQGLAILATNMKGALDPAFMRRLRFIVSFPFPAVSERKQMWQRVFPKDTPVATLNYDRLARLNLTGGSIQNIALNSAFLAAHSGGTINMPLLLDAARAEFRKLEKPINEADFRWLESAGDAA